MLRGPTASGRQGGWTHLSEWPLHPSWYQRCALSLAQYIPRPHPKPRKNRCFQIEARSKAPLSAPAFSSLAASPRQPPSLCWRPQSPEPGSTFILSPASRRPPGFRQTPGFPPQAGLAFTSPPPPTPALCDERQWCKIRWGEKQEVVPESMPAEALPRRRLWRPLPPQPYRKVAGGSPSPSCGDVGGGEGGLQHGTLWPRGALFLARTSHLHPAFYIFSYLLARPPRLAQ